MSDQFVFIILVCSITILLILITHLHTTRARKINTSIESIKNINATEFLDKNKVRKAHNSHIGTVTIFGYVIGFIIANFQQEMNLWKMLGFGVPFALLFMIIGLLVKLVVTFFKKS